MLTKQDLIAFEQEISDIYCAGNIRAPIHLSDGNEEVLIEIFKDIKPEDRIFCSWRSHYHCLLKGVPREELKAAITNGESITLNFPQYNIFSSAIVGGIIPIALGSALGIKLNKGTEHVYCFVGDMTAEHGLMWEALKYSNNFELPITFVIEDNNQSVGTPTDVVWGYKNNKRCEYFSMSFPNVIYYKYSKCWPHVGSGVHVIF